MQYTTMEKLGVKVSRLGFGCMRFPTTPDGKIDEPRAAAMLDRAYKAGVNYFDTAYFYHSGESERFVGRAMKAYPRESFYLATKLPLSLIKTVEDAKRIFEEQLSKLQVEYFDFYLLHGINAEGFDRAVQSGVLDYVMELQKSGRVRHLGFSFHGKYEDFEKIITYREWDFCQIQLNYMDVENQQGVKGYELATKLGVPVVIMEPVKGGSLATLSDDIAASFKAERPDASVASWAMRWIGSLENCRVILSGMTTEEQLEDNLATFSAFEPLSEHEQETIAKVREEIKSRVFIGCTGCKYCMPCPAGVDIPRNFSMMNEFAMYNNKRHLDWVYNSSMKTEERAAACVKCGACEAACPQQLPIREKLAEIAAKMEKKES